jgi:predicted negative regulator of RcsB-dependent stress response/NAD-dependent dihydropyrimidine dehydrogenase PreA subunit
VGSHTPAPVPEPSAATLDRRPRRYGRKRAACLALVYLLMIAHFVHWRLAGRTLAPVELSETMHTLELGIVTAGFLLMLVAVASVAVFGRFFCSWGCHILALEDLCAWGLRKIGIRPKPVRSRLLLIVPWAAALYMFAWPLVLRAIEGAPAPGLHVASDAEGWSSFVTQDYWRSMPGIGISIFTLAICGFATVYFLGTRSFCTYACPYGAVFAAADRLAVGRIVRVGDCTGCGECTSACRTNIRVHEELIQFGHVVTPACLKAMDCVSACPHGSISYGFTRPSLFRSWRKHGRFGVPYDFSLGEDLLLLATFLVGLAAFRGLYDAVPFLLTLALAAILGFLAVTALRLLRVPNVRLVPFQLKLRGQITNAGRVFAVAVVALGALTAHSGFIRYHEALGARAYERAAQAFESRTQDGDSTRAALRHYAACARYGLVRPLEIDRRIASLYVQSGDPQAAEAYVRRILERTPDDAEWRLTLAAILLTREDADAALDVLAPATATASPTLRAAAHEMRAEIRLAQGRPADAEREYESALSAWPESPRARAGLAQLRAASP